MTFWSRKDSVNMPRGYTDHWSKMKIKATTLANRDDALSYGPVLTDAGKLWSQ
jgi:hypothetical protein